MGDFSITVVDILVVLVVLVSAAYAVYRGLMRETLSIFAWVAASFVTLRFFPNFRPLLHGVVEPMWVADVLVFVGMFLIVLVPLSFMSFRFSETVKRSEVGPVDRTLGFVFGVGRGLVIVGLAYVSFISISGNHPKWLTGAQLFPVIQDTGEVLLGLVPDEDEVLPKVREARSTRPVSQTVPKNVPKPVPKSSNSVDKVKNEASYGARDRRALDSLVESTGAR